MNTCPQCGAAAPRVEVSWGDDEDEFVYEYTCHKCEYVWQEKESELLSRKLGGG